MEKELDKEWTIFIYNGKATNYLISNYGEISPLDSSEEKIRINVVKGMYRACLKIEGKTVQKFVHRMVAESFCVNPDPESLKYVEHVDGNKLNNISTNLVWRKQNPSQGYRNSFKMLNHRKKKAGDNE